MNNLHTTALAVTDVSCIRQQQPLFAPISFALNAGEMMLIEGPNGSGKSSLLRIVCGLATPALGNILWQGQCIQTVREKYVECLHYVGHQNGLKLGLTIAENVALAERLLCCHSRGNDKFNDELTALSLTAYLHTPVKQLSAGQKRKVALLKLFLFPKTLWLLDEPLTALDAATQIYFLSKLETHLEQGGLCVMSSHQSLPFQIERIKSVRLLPC